MIAVAVVDRSDTQIGYTQQHDSTASKQAPPMGQQQSVSLQVRVATFALAASDALR